MSECPCFPSAALKDWEVSLPLKEAGSQEVEWLCVLSLEGDPRDDDEARGIPGRRQAAGPALLQRPRRLEVDDP